jgi:hypothetical protein
LRLEIRYSDVAVVEARTPAIPFERDSVLQVLLVISLWEIAT